MQAEDELLKNRIKDLANRSYNDSRYTFTNFLSLADVSCYYEIEREVSFAGSTLFGGADICERVVLRFGSVEQLGYEEPFPISVIRISPLMGKFSDDLTHRDFLGALMNLGIEREVLGDIFVEDKSAVIFCLDSMAEYISENLTRIKHTSVKTEILEECPKLKASEGEIITVQVASERVDALISKVYNLSRSDSIELFMSNRVFVNGRLCTGNSKTLKAGDRVSVRGFGKFEFTGVTGTTRKGKLSTEIKIYRG